MPRVTAGLKSVGLCDFATRKPAELSGGQQQRVALARSMVMEPKVLLLDEPLSNLDARLRLEMRAELQRVQKETGVTMIFVTHDQVEALALADRIVVMLNGGIEQIGTPEEIYNNRSPLSLPVSSASRMSSSWSAACSQRRTAPSICQLLRRRPQAWPGGRARSSLVPVLFKALCAAAPLPATRVSICWTPRSGRSRPRWMQACRPMESARRSPSTSRLPRLQPSLVSGEVDDHRPHLDGRRA